MNEENESPSKLAQETLLYTAIASRHPFIALAMREGWFGPRAQSIAAWNETKIMSKKAMWQLVTDFTDQLEEDEWEERRQNLAESDIEGLKEQVVRLHDPKAYAKEWEKANASDPS